MKVVVTRPYVPPSYGAAVSPIVPTSGVYYRELRGTPRVFSDLYPFRCYVCGDLFKDARGLRLHEGTSHGVFRCLYPGCEQAFPHSKTLVFHELNFHKSLVCSGCDAAVKGSLSIHKHLSEAHGQSVPMICICEKCNIFFSNHSQYAQHCIKDHGSHFNREDISGGPRAAKRVVRIGDPRMVPPMKSMCGSMSCSKLDNNSQEVHLTKLLGKLMEELRIHDDPGASQSIDRHEAVTGVNVYEFDSHQV